MKKTERVAKTLKQFDAAVGQAIEYEKTHSPVEPYLRRKPAKKAMWKDLLILVAIFVASFLIQVIWGATHAHANTPIHKGEEILTAKEFCSRL